jgi:hypothetical protein
VMSRMDSSSAPRSKKSKGGAGLSPIPRRDELVNDLYIVDRSLRRIRRTHCRCILKELIRQVEVFGFHMPARRPPEQRSSSSAVTEWPRAWASRPGRMNGRGSSLAHCEMRNPRPSYPTGSRCRMR